MRIGNQVTREQGFNMNRYVTNEMVDMIIKNIDDDKAPDLNGSNAIFFNILNCTLITLIPIIHNASHVKYFRPIT